MVCVSSRVSRVILDGFSLFLSSTLQGVFVVGFSYRLGPSFLV